MKEPDRINYELPMPGRKRQIVRPAIQRDPWWSPYRPRNMIIMACFMGCLPFASTIIDMVKGFKNNFRLLREQEEFNKELDMEEAMEVANKRK